jgi:hypothetical protein
LALPSMKIVPLTVSVFAVAFQEISPLVVESSQASENASERERDWLACCGRRRVHDRRRARDAEHGHDPDRHHERHSALASKAQPHAKPPHVECIGSATPENRPLSSGGRTQPEKPCGGFGCA